MSKVDKIVEIVLQLDGKTMDQITNKGRKIENVMCRHKIHYALKKFTKLSLENIGKVTNRGHDTVLHSIGVVSNMIETNKTFKLEIESTMSSISDMLESKECHLEINPSEINTYKDCYISMMSLINPILKDLKFGTKILSDAEINTAFIKIAQIKHRALQLEK